MLTRDAASQAFRHVVEGQLRWCVGEGAFVVVETVLTDRFPAATHKRAGLPKR
jgi:hypothetical protein